MCSFYLLALRLFARYLVEFSNNYFRFSFETSQQKEKLQANVNVSLLFVIIV